MPWAKWARREKEFVYETTDKDKLAMAERFLTHPLRVANEVPSVSGPGNYCVGRVEVTTSKSNFIAGISTSGFLMDTEIPMSRNAFFTWGLAKLMDEALFQQTKEHLPAELMSHLSGQNCIDYEKSIYEEGVAKKPAGKER